MKSRLSKLRLFHVAFIASVPLYGWFAENIRHRGSSNWTSWHWVVTGLALCVALAGFRLRRRIIGRSEKALAKDASDPKALKQWEAGQLIGLAFAENIALWGVLLRVVLAGALWEASLFYAAGLFLLLLWTPQMPTTPAV
jgi:F0F1-type ATP synthase membrane subunit c/vacuolar-type H+-ATPase subunit K